LRKQRLLEHPASFQKDLTARTGEKKGKVDFFFGFKKDPRAEKAGGRKRKETGDVRVATEKKKKRQDMRGFFTRKEKVRLGKSSRPGTKPGNL